MPSKQERKNWPLEIGYTLWNDQSEVEGGFGPDAKSLPPEYGLEVENPKGVDAPITAPNLKIKAPWGK